MHLASPNRQGIYAHRYLLRTLQVTFTSKVYYMCVLATNVISRVVCLTVRFLSRREGWYPKFVSGGPRHLFSAVHYPTSGRGLSENFLSLIEPQKFVCNLNPLIASHQMVNRNTQTLCHSSGIHQAHLFKSWI